MIPALGRQRQEYHEFKGHPELHSNTLCETKQNKKKMMMENFTAISTNLHFQNHLF
jgi:hypothetical protein